MGRKFWRICPSLTLWLCFEPMPGLNGLWRSLPTSVILDGFLVWGASSQSQLEVLNEESMGKYLSF